MTVRKEDKINIIKQHQKHSNDTGSSEVQIGIYDARIEDLKEHFKRHKKDKHSRRGLITIINKRKKLLKYLNRKK